MVALPLELFATKGIRPASSLEAAPRAPSRPCDWAELDRILPDGGLPHGVVEIVSASAMMNVHAGSTAIATAAVRAAQKRDARAWCAWIDPERSLYAPGLLRIGIDLERLFVVRPPQDQIARVAVKVASSGAFDILVVEIGSGLRSAKQTEALVRKLAIAAEQHGATIVLLSSPHSSPWPVALRLEVARTPSGLTMRITKERHGRLALAKTSIPIA